MPTAKSTDMAMGLRYVDRFERRDGEWRITKRICAFDWAYYIDADRSGRSPTTSPSAHATRPTSRTRGSDMAVDRQMIEFTPDDIEAVVKGVGGVIERGTGWLNIEPIVGEAAMDDIRRTAPPAMVRVFSAQRWQDSLRHLRAR